MIDLRKEPNNLPQSIDDIWMFCPKFSRWIIGYASSLDEGIRNNFMTMSHNQVHPTHWAHIHDYPPPPPEQ